MKEKETTLKRKMDRKLKVFLREITLDIDTLTLEINAYESSEYQDNTFDGTTKEHPMDMVMQYPEEMIQPIIWGDAL
jgi:hypothetical protein